jgi:hypothetical protein
MLIILFLILVSLKIKFSLSKTISQCPGMINLTFGPPLNSKILKIHQKTKNHLIYLNPNSI